MKRFSFLVFLIIPFLLSSQTDHFSKKNALKISPVEFGKAEFQVSYERYFGDRSSSITISPSFILKETSLESKEGFQLGLQYRIFLSHLRSDNGNVFLGFHNIGFYTGLYAQHLSYTEDYQYMWYVNNTSHSEEFTKDLSSTEGGALIGVQIDITNRILIDFYVGGGVRYSDLTDTKDEAEIEDYYGEAGVFDLEYKGVKPKIGFQLGILF